MSVITAGIDVGTSAAKAVVLGFEHAGATPIVLSKHVERIHRRDPKAVAALALAHAFENAQLARSDVAYVATTGEGDALESRDGHFYGMTTHARGARFLVPQARSAIDAGALHARVLVFDERSKVLRSRMTSQCASGTGQFLENIARYLGIRSAEIGPLSLGATRAEPCSGICAVLSETDVINMVSRGISTGEILRGVHESIAQRLVRLLRSTQAESAVLLTGGLGLDSGLAGAIERAIANDGGKPLEVVTHPLCIYAGAIGAALWGEFRLRKLADTGATTLCTS